MPASDAHTPSPARHLAITYQGGGSFAVEQLDTETPPPGHVRIDVAYTGICGTDLTISHGAMDHRITSPWPIGHEMSGTIAVVGAGVDEGRVGDQVTVMPLDWCGDCPACNAGHQHICHNLNFVGIDSPGSLQQRWNVRADLLVPLPGNVALRDAALVEPVAVAVHDVRRSGLAAGDDVLVIGGGPIGLLIALVAREAGANVLISEISRTRRELGELLGFRVVDPAAESVVERTRAWTSNKGADVAFEVSGSAAGVRALTEVLATRGKGVVVAIHSKPPEVDLFQVFWKELEIIGTRVYEREDFVRAVSLIAEGVIPTHRLITDVVPLRDAASVFARLSSGEDIVKLLVDCR